MAKSKKKKEALKPVKEDKRLKKNYNVFILDKSGSMESVAKETREGFNEQVQELKENADKYSDQEFYATFITFNGTAELIFLNEKVSELYELKEDDYVPGGTTALFDALNLGLTKVVDDLGDELKEDNSVVDAAVSVVVMTDGYENTSSYANINKVPGMIKELQGTGKWTFAYIGANQDVEAMAKKMNIPVSNTMAYTSDQNGTKRAFAAMRMSSESYYSKRSKGISGQSLQNTFFEDEDGKKITADEDKDSED